MANQQAIDQIAKSISFEVEAIPQDNTIQLTSTANTTPLNVKIKVRKKQGVDVAQNAVVCIPKLGKPGAAPERVRLVSSDQTIMSFNVFMENEQDAKAPRKAKKGFFGFLRPGARNEGEDQIKKNNRSKSLTLKDKDRQDSANELLNETEESPMQADSILDVNYSQAEKIKNKKGILGKYKPGGCLDPPFGEDRYVYEKKKRASPVQSVPLTMFDNDKPSAMYKTEVYPKKKKIIAHQALDKKSQEDNAETFSNSEIHFPVVTTSEQEMQERVNEKNMKNNISSTENNFRSSSANMYFNRNDWKNSKYSNYEQNQQKKSAMSIATQIVPEDSVILLTNSYTAKLETGLDPTLSSKTQFKLQGESLLPSRSSNQVIGSFESPVKDQVSLSKTTPVSDVRREPQSTWIKNKAIENEHNTTSETLLSKKTGPGEIIETNIILTSVKSKPSLVISTELTTQSYSTKEVSLKSSTKSKSSVADSQQSKSNEMHSTTAKNGNEPMHTISIEIGNANLISKGEHNGDYSEKIPMQLISNSPTISPKYKSAFVLDRHMIPNEKSVEISVKNDTVSSKTSSKIMRSYCSDSPTKIQMEIVSNKMKKSISNTSSASKMRDNSIFNSESPKAHSGLTVTETFSNSDFNKLPDVTISEQEMQDRINEKNMKNKITTATNSSGSDSQTKIQMNLVSNKMKKSLKHTAAILKSPKSSGENLYLKATHKSKQISDNDTENLYDMQKVSQANISSKTAKTNYSNYGDVNNDLKKTTPLTPYSGHTVSTIQDNDVGKSFETTSAGAPKSNGLMETKVEIGNGQSIDESIAEFNLNYKNIAAENDAKLNYEVNHKNTISSLVIQIKSSPSKLIIDNSVVPLQSSVENNNSYENTYFKATPILGPNYSNKNAEDSKTMSNFSSQETLKALPVKYTKSKPSQALDNVLTLDEPIVNESISNEVTSKMSDLSLEGKSISKQTTTYFTPKEDTINNEDLSKASEKNKAISTTTERLLKNMTTLHPSSVQYINENKDAYNVVNTPDDNKSICSKYSKTSPNELENDAVICRKDLLKTAALSILSNTDSNKSIESNLASNTFPLQKESFISRKNNVSNDIFGIGIKPDEMTTDMSKIESILTVKHSKSLLTYAEPTEYMPDETTENSSLIKASITSSKNKFSLESSILNATSSIINKEIIPNKTLFLKNLNNVDDFKSIQNKVIALNSSRTSTKRKLSYADDNNSMLDNLSIKRPLETEDNDTIRISVISKTSLRNKHLNDSPSMANEKSSKILLSRELLNFDIAVEKTLLSKDEINNDRSRSMPSINGGKDTVKELYQLDIDTIVAQPKRKTLESSATIRTSQSVGSLKPSTLVEDTTVGSNINVDDAINDFVSLEKEPKDIFEQNINASLINNVDSGFKKSKYLGELEPSQYEEENDKSMYDLNKEISKVIEPIESKVSTAGITTKTEPKKQLDTVSSSVKQAQLIEKPLDLKYQTGLSDKIGSRSTALDSAIENIESQIAKSEEVVDKYKPKNTFYPMDETAIFPKISIDKDIDELAAFVDLGTGTTKTSGNQMNKENIVKSTKSAVLETLSSSQLESASDKEEVYSPKLPIVNIIPKTESQLQRTSSLKDFQTEQYSNSMDKDLLRETSKISAKLSTAQLEDFYSKQEGLVISKTSDSVLKPVKYESIVESSSKIRRDTPKQSLKNSIIKAENAFSRQFTQLKSNKDGIKDSVTKPSEIDTQLVNKSNVNYLLMDLEPNNVTDNLTTGIKKQIVESSSLTSIQYTDQNNILVKVHKNGTQTNEGTDESKLKLSSNVSKYVNATTFDSKNKFENTVKDESNSYLETYNIAPKTKEKKSLSNANHLIDTRKEQDNNESHRSEHKIEKISSSTSTIPVSGAYANQTMKLPDAVRQRFLEESDYSNLSEVRTPSAFALASSLKSEGRLQSETLSEQSEAIVLDIAFQSYVNDRYERVLKSFDSSLPPERFQDDSLAIFRTTLQPADMPVKVPFDSSTDISLFINKRDFLLRETSEKYDMTPDIITHIKDYKNPQPEQEKSETKSFDNDDNNLQRVLSTVYNSNMVPLQSIIKNLKDDIDALATQQELFRQKIMVSNKPKMVRINPVVKRCGCLRR